MPPIARATGVIGGVGCPAELQESQGRAEGPHGYLRRTPRYAGAPAPARTAGKGVPRNAPAAPGALAAGEALPGGLGPAHSHGENEPGEGICSFSPPTSVRGARQP